MGLGGAGVAAGAGEAAAAGGAFSAADAIGLAQMGEAAGLTGSALDAFVASGGTLGSTAAGTIPTLGAGWTPDPSGALGGQFTPIPGTLPGPALAGDPLFSSFAGGAAGGAAGGGGGETPGPQTPNGPNIPQTPPTPPKSILDKAKDKAIDAGISTATSTAARALLGADGEVLPPVTYDQEGVKRRVNEIWSNLTPQFAQEEDDITNTTRDDYGADLKRKQDEASRQLKFGAARSGNVNSPIYAQQAARLEEDRALGGTRIGEASQRAVNELRSAREGARSGAMQLALSGTGDEAVNALTAGTQNALNSARSQQKDSLFYDLFQDLSLSKAGGDRSAYAGDLAALVAQTKQRLGAQPYSTAKNKGPVIIPT
jgi:hypothetical protein